MNKKQYNKLYYILHKIILQKKAKEYYYNHIQIIKKYKNLNKKRIKKYMNKYISFHKQEKIKYDKNYYLKNKERLLESHSKWQKNNRTKINRYIITKRNKDLNFKISHYLRTRIVRILKGNPKLETTMNLLGCSIDKLKKHLESKFTKGMNWNNYGKWHIDHIKPCAAFDLSKESEQRKCFHYTNLQPLWAEDNLRKGDRYV